VEAIGVRGWTWVQGLSANSFILVDVIVKSIVGPYNPDLSLVNEY